MCLKVYDNVSVIRNFTIFFFNAIYFSSFLVYRYKHI